MKRNLKKVFATVLALVMALALCVPVFAATADTTHTVTIYVQEATRNADGDVTSQKALAKGPVTVVVNDGQTLKEAIVIACEQGAVISMDKWNPEYPQYLTSLAVGSTTYANKDSYEKDTPTVGQTTYKGDSWMYFNGTPQQMPASSYAYPNVSLGEAKVTDNVTITLSFEHLTYVY